MRRLLASAAVLFLPLAAFAQAGAGSEARLRDALRAATGQLRALEDEQAKALSREAGLKAEAEKLRAELQATRRAAAADRHRGRSADVLALQRQLETKTAEAEKTAAALGACTGAAEAEAQASRLREQERIDAVAAQARCRQSRSRLYSVAKEALQKLGDGGVCEPVFGFKRVALENLVQDYQDKLDEELSPRAAAPAPGAAK